MNGGGCSDAARGRRPRQTRILETRMFGGSGFRSSPTSVQLSPLAAEVEHHRMRPCRVLGDGTRGPAPQRIRGLSREQRGRRLCATFGYGLSSPDGECVPGGIVERDHWIVYCSRARGDASLLGGVVESEFARPR